LRQYFARSPGGGQFFKNHAKKIATLFREKKANGKIIKKKKKKSTAPLHTSVESVLNSERVQYSYLSQLIQHFSISLQNLHRSHL